MMMLVASIALVAASSGPPPTTDKAGTARWMVANINWGVIASKSIHLHGVPFGNANSFLGVSNGNLYFYVSPMDTSVKDIAADNHVSFTISEAGMKGFCSVTGSNNASLPDPEDPTCARLTVSGIFHEVDNATAKTIAPQMFARHPQMSKWPTGHGWFFATIDISDLWLIDYYGGAALIPPSDYFAAPPPKAASKATAEANKEAQAATGGGGAVVVEEEAVADYDFRMGPPPGPNNTARCPVTGTEVVFGGVASLPPSVTFKHGQRLWFSSASAAAAYKASPRDYWLAPHDKPLPSPDGMRGLPDLRGENVTCPRSGEVVTVDMKSPRVVHKHGQAVYFCCFGCVATFWQDPTPFIVA